MEAAIILINERMCDIALCPGKNDFSLDIFFNPSIKQNLMTRINIEISKYIFFKKYIYFIKLFSPCLMRLLQ